MKPKLLLLALLFLLLGNQAFASHIVGGELGLERQPSGSYRLYLNQYFDVLYGQPGAEDPSVVVTIFEKGTDQIVESFTLPKARTLPVQYSNPQCSSGGSLVTKLIVYEDFVILPPTRYKRPQGYYASWERCCRNDVITNLLSPGATGMVFYCEFPPVERNGAPFINSTPRFGTVAGDYLCLRSPYTYSFAATDADGDSLAYALVQPLKGHTSTSTPIYNGLSGPYSNVFWSGGFSLGNIIPGAPTLTIDQQTGQLLVNPTMLGLFVFSVQVTEFRNGVKIGEMRRDFQWKVQDCLENEPPKVSVLLPGGATYTPGDTIVVTTAEDRCFDLRFIDSVNSKLTFEVVPVDFTAPVVSISPSSGTIPSSGVPIISKICWPDCSDTRSTPYTFDVIVRDNGCPLAKSATIRIKVLVIPEPNVPPAISTSLASNVQYLVLDGSSIEFDVTGTDADSSDIVSLSAAGVGFNLADYGMTFPGGSAPLTITSPFRWQAGCNALLANQPLRVIFTARDNSCFNSHQDTVSVLFYIRDRDNQEVLFKDPANVFTPNNDGVNDVYRFPNLPLDDCNGHFEKVEVYDRWGKRVYRGQTREAAWDGLGQTDGIYYYLITFSNRTYKGTVTLLR